MEVIYEVPLVFRITLVREYSPYAQSARVIKRRTPFVLQLRVDGVAMVENVELTDELFGLLLRLPAEDALAMQKHLSPEFSMSVGMMEQIVKAPKTLLAHVVASQSSTARQISLFPGMQVQTLLGEMDTDSDGVERNTPPGSWGHISCLNHKDQWDVCFPNGVWVVLTDAELNDPSQYSLSQPRTLEQCALALKHGQELQELTFMDGRLMPFTETIAGNPDLILEALAEARRIKEDALDLLSVLRNTHKHWGPGGNAAVGGALERMAGKRFPWEQVQQVDGPIAQAIESKGGAIQGATSSGDEMSDCHEVECLGSSHKPRGG